MTNVLRLTEQQLVEINARNRAHIVRPMGKPDPVDPPKNPTGRPKAPPKTREQIRDEKIKRLARRQEQREAKREYKTSKGEADLILQMRLAGITDYVREYRFLPGRLYRLDFAWPRLKLAVEVEGGTWSDGRHVRGGGFAKDCEKYNALTLAGWHLLRYTTEMVKSGIATQQIAEMLVKLQTGSANSSQDQNLPR